MGRSDQLDRMIDVELDYAVIEKKERDASLWRQYENL